MTGLAAEQQDGLNGMLIQLSRLRIGSGQAGSAVLEPVEQQLAFVFGQWWFVFRRHITG